MKRRLLLTSIYFRMVQPQRTSSNLLEPLSLEWFDCTEPSRTFEKGRGGSMRLNHPDLVHEQGVQGAYGVVQVHRTFSNHIIAEIARCVEFFHMSSGYVSLFLTRSMTGEVRCFNPRRACAARVTVVVPCVCVFVCPGLASATHATTRPSRHTYGLSIVLAPE